MPVTILMKKDMARKYGFICLFRSITLKHIISLTTIDALRCIGGLEVAHQTLMLEIPSLIPDSVKMFIFGYFSILFYYCCVLLFWSINHYLS